MIKLAELQDFFNIPIMKHVLDAQFDPVMQYRLNPKYE